MNPVVFVYIPVCRSPLHRIALCNEYGADRCCQNKSDEDSVSLTCFWSTQVMVNVKVLCSHDARKDGGTHERLVIIWCCLFQETEEPLLFLLYSLQLLSCYVCVSAVSVCEHCKNIGQKSEKRLVPLFP